MAVVAEVSHVDAGPVGWELALLELLADHGVSGFELEEVVRRWHAKVLFAPEVAGDPWPVFEGEPCWLWTAARNRRGYGKLRVRDVVLYAHRIGFALAGLRVPRVETGLELDHLCRVRSCVRASHLEVVTHAENLRRHYDAQGACLRGHPRIPENVSRDARGRIRYCLVCRREKRRAGEWS